MTELTPVRAAWLRIRAQRVEREVDHIYHRVLVADPYMAHPDTERDLNSAARCAMNANAIARNLTAYLEAHK